MFVVDTNLLVYDARTAILMRENGIKTIYTRDSDFKRFAFVVSSDPITEHSRELQ